MGFFSIALAACLVAFTFADDTCPQASALAPCTCDGEGVNCMGAVNIDQIKKAFRANFKYGGVRAIWVQGTKVTNIPGDLFGNIKSQQFYIEVNNVTQVDLNAFKNSQNILNTLSFFGNQLSSFAFSDLQRFPNLRVLNFGRNQFRSIPNNAFKNPNLIVLILAQNQISSIGPYAFQSLASLQRLELTMNRLTTLGPNSLSCPSHNPQFQIQLAGNQISSVSNSAFDGTTPAALFLSQNRLTSLPYSSFIQLVSRMAQIGGFLEVSYNPFTCKGCDYNWMIQNRNAATQMLIGFRCPDGTGVPHLTNQNIGC